MAPPPLVDLFDWRGPYVPLFGVICVSRVNESCAFGDGLRAPPRSGRFSPAARANGVTSNATRTAATTIQGPWPRPSRRRRMLVSIGNGPPWLMDGRRTRACDVGDAPCLPLPLQHERAGEGCGAARPLSEDGEQWPPPRHVAQPVR